MSPPAPAEHHRAAEHYAGTLRMARHRRRLRQIDLAAKTGVSLTTIKRYESGESTPNAVQLVRIAQVLGWNARSFIPPESPKGAAEDAADI
ncbi:MULTISPECIES: helix-turn-helix domain-containing protein [Nocardia]|uniref:helix-turn-helix domain-containing protein n=1 Tax=Nocardia TaxID=1817 RepID=UPI002458B8A7|nr:MULTISPECIES: helix-turn-helix transcriptional regulator [Nocardia]